MTSRLVLVVDALRWSHTDTGRHPLHMEQTNEVTIRIEDAITITVAASVAPLTRLLVDAGFEIYDVT